MTLSIRLILLSAFSLAYVPFANAQPHFDACASRTAETATVIIGAEVVNDSKHPLEAGDEIAVVTEEGECVGASVWRDSSFAITVWGMDPFSEGSGMKAGKPLKYVVWDASDGQEYAEVSAKYTGGKPYLSTDGIFAKGAVYEIASLTVAGSVSDSQNPAEAATFALEQNYPNPVSSATTIRYGLETDEDVRIELYNMLGQRVSILESEPKKAGRHEVHLDARDLPSGAYIYRLQAGQFVASKTLVIVK